MSEQSNPFEAYLNKAVKIVCKDQRVIYGTLACVSSPYSIILQHAVCQQPKLVEIELDYHYNPQFPAKHFLPRLDPEILTSFEDVANVRNKLSQNPPDKESLETLLTQLLVKTELAKQHNQEFMKDKYVIGSVVISGENIEKIHLLT